MSSKVFLFPLILLLSISAFSQNSYGLKVDTNYTIIEGNPKNEIIVSGFDYRYKSSYQIGVFANFIIKSNLTLKIELLFADKGSITKSLNTKEEYNYHLYYINTPLLIGHKLFDVFTMHSMYSLCNWVLNPVIC